MSLSIKGNADAPKKSGNNQNTILDSLKNSGYTAHQFTTKFTDELNRLANVNDRQFNTKNPMSENLIKDAYEEPQKPNLPMDKLENLKKMPESQERVFDTKI